MSSESIIIDIQMRLSDAERDLARLNDRMNNTSRSGTAMRGSMAAAGSAVAAVGAAAVVAGGALAAMVVTAASAEREMQNLASVAKTTTEDFKALSFAASQFGLDAKGTADAMNDVVERLGEFAVGEGGGAFVDFADAMRMSTEEATALADELKNMSGEGAIRELSSRLHEAGVTGGEMSFVMKSLSSDLEYLSPLFTEQAAELDRLKTRYFDATKEMQLNEDQQNRLREASESFTLATKQLGDSASLISSALAPAFDEFFNSVIDTVPDATLAIVDFINSFKDAENIETLAEIDRQIEDSISSIKQLEKVIKSGSMTVGFGSLGGMVTTKKDLQNEKDKLAELNAQRDALLVRDKERAAEKVEEEEKQAEIAAELEQSREDLKHKKRIQALEESLKSEQEKLDEQYAANLQLAEGNEELIFKVRQDYAEKTAALTKTVDGGNKELDTLLDRLKSEQQLLDEKYAYELQLLGENEEAKLALLAEYTAEAERIKNADPLEKLKESLMTEEELLIAKYEKDIELAQENADLKFKINQKLADDLAELDAQRAFKLSKLGKEEKKEAEDLADDKADAEESFRNSAIAAGEMIFEDNKLVRAGMAVVDTASGITRAFAENPAPVAIPLAASIALNGAMQLATIKGSSKGGGSVASAAVTIPEVSEVAGVDNEQEIYQTSSDVSGSNQTVVNVVLDGEVIGKAAYNNINKMQQSGLL